MAIRAALTFVFLTFILVFVSSVAPADEVLDLTGDVSPVKILPYSALMKLTRDQQVMYIAGVRDILGEFERMQKTSHRSPSEKKRTNAQIEFLKMFIAEAEAADRPFTPKPMPGCPYSVYKRDVLQAQAAAGATFACLAPPANTCPIGSRDIGKANGRVICYNNRKMNVAKYRENLAKAKKYEADKAVEAKAKLASRAAEKEKLSLSRQKSLQANLEERKAKSNDSKPKRKVASSGDTSPQNKTTRPAGGSSNDDDSVPLTDGQPPSDDAPSSPDQIAAARALDANPGKKDSFDHVKHDDRKMSDFPNGSRSTAESTTATMGSRAGDRVTQTFDEDGDYHDIRRQIIGFKMTNADSDARLDLENANAESVESNVCNKPPPAVAPECSDEAKHQAEQQLSGGWNQHCLTGGMMSHYTNGLKVAGNCAPTNLFCLNTLVCNDKAGNKMTHAQVTLSCASDETVCNPYLFDVQKTTDGGKPKPFCAKNNSDVLASCNDQSTKDTSRTFYLNTTSNNGVMEGWNEFAREFNHICFDDRNDKQKQDDEQNNKAKPPEPIFYCEECSMMKARLWNLHRSVMNSVINQADGTDKKTGDENLCYRMSKLLPCDSTNGGSGGSNKAGKAHDFAR